MAVFSGNGAIGSPSFTFSSDNDTGFYRPAANELSIVTGGANAIYIDDSQRLGLRDATNPTTSIDIQVDDGTAYSSTNIPYDSEAVVKIFNTDQATSATKFSGLSLETYGAATTNRTRASIGLIKPTASGSSGSLVFGLRDNSFGAVEECMRITSSKTVGINLTNPGAALDIDSTGTPLIVRQGGVEALRVNSSGDVDVAAALITREVNLEGRGQILKYTRNNVGINTDVTAFTVTTSGTGTGSNHFAIIPFRLLVGVASNSSGGSFEWCTYAYNGMLSRGDSTSSPVLTLGTPEILTRVLGAPQNLTITVSLTNVSVSGADFSIQYSASNPPVYSALCARIDTAYNFSFSSFLNIEPV